MRNYLKTVTETDFRHILEQNISHYIIHFLRILILVILQSLPDEADLERGRRVHHELRGLAPQHQARLAQGLLHGERRGLDSTKSFDNQVREGSIIK